MRTKMLPGETIHDAVKRAVARDPVTLADQRTMKERFGVDWAPYPKKRRFKR